MSISIDNIYGSYMTQMTENAKSSASADGVKKSTDKLSAQSSEAEMKQAIKDFESYFIEQILKEAEESLTEGSFLTGSGDQLTQYFLGNVNEKIADQILDQVGERTTQMLYEQMRRNYGIPETDSE